MQVYCFTVWGTNIALRTRRNLKKIIDLKITVKYAQTEKAVVILIRQGGINNIVMEADAL